MKPRAVLFDIGSTLWSSPAEDPDALARCYGWGRDVIIAAGLVAPPLEDLIQTVEGHFAEWEDIWRSEPGRVEQPPTAEYVERALAKLDLKLPVAELAAFTEAVLDTSVYTAMVEPQEPENGAALKALLDLGLRLACVSNAFMPGSVLDRILDARGMGEHCEFTVSSCEFGIRKPDPRIYQEAVRRLGLPAPSVVFVGDRVDADVEGPAAVGMQTVLTHQYRQEDPGKGSRRPDYVVSHLSELVTYLGGLLEDA
jgi:FMN phosphatase YigB (HAD superfamily)